MGQEETEVERRLKKALQVPVTGSLKANKVSKCKLRKWKKSNQSS